MSAIYSTQVWAGLLPQGQTLLYTVPEDKTLVIVDVELSNFTPAPGLFLIGNGSAGSLDVIALAVNDIPSSSHEQWRGRIVFKPGEEVVASWDHPGMIHVWVSTYLLG